MNLTGEYVLMSKNLIPSLKADILIIDDTPDNLRLLNQILSQHYKVRLAPSGDIGLKAAHSAPPDLILLDVMMSGMNGYEVATQLKADEQTAEIPIIFISALDNTESKVLGFTVGGVDYITKPFQEREVLARVQTHLSLRALYLQAQKEIAERKRAEESLRKREQEYKTLVENTPDVIARFDRQYRHIYVNPVVEKEF
jgi:PleD family two-component response regulator